MAAYFTGEICRLKGVRQNDGNALAPRLFVSAMTEDIFMRDRASEYAGCGNINNVGYSRMKRRAAVVWVAYEFEHIMRKSAIEKSPLQRFNDHRRHPSLGYSF